MKLKTTAQPNLSLKNGFEILELLVFSKKELSTGEISRMSGLNKSVVSRMLLTLNELGYVARVGRGIWRTHAGLMALSIFGLKNSPLSRSQPILNEMIKKLRCLVAIGFIWKDNVVYLFHSSKEEVISGFGNIYPVKKSAIGQLLSDPRNPRYKIVRRRQQNEFSLAVPFHFEEFDYGLAIAGPKSLYRGEETIRLLRSYADRIEQLAIGEKPDQMPPDRRADNR